MLDVKTICSAVLFCSAVVGDSFELTKCAEEADCIDKIKPLVARNDRELTIMAKEGANNVIRFVDEIPSVDEEKSNMVRHKLVAYHAERRIFIVANQYYEDVDFTLVNAEKGEKLSVNASPNFSPSGKRFVCVVDSGGPTDLTQNYDFGIWSIDKGSFRQEMLYKNPPEEGNSEWTFVGWEGEDRIKLKVAQYDNGEKIEREAEIISTPQGWKVNVLYIRQ